MSGEFASLLRPKAPGTCRVCGAQNCLHNAISRNTRICNQCMRQKQLTLRGGTIVRFCYGHRQLESLDQFKLDKSR